MNIKRFEHTCNKCNNLISNLNDNEQEEFNKYLEFTCSTCINQEMVK